MIEIAQLSKSIGQKVVLSNVNLGVKTGETLVIIGRSGAGKSVLLKNIVGLIKPDSGSIKINGVDVTGITEREYNKIRMEMGMVFQGGALFDSMSVEENVAFVLNEFMSLDRKTVRDKVEEALAMVSLQGIEEMMPSQLSGGMKKRVGLARAIVLGAKILLCDEPTSGLDPIRSRDISNLISNVSRRLHCTTVVTSHDIPNSFRIADRLALIHNGQMVAAGTKEQLRENQDPFVKEFIKL